MISIFSLKKASATINNSLQLKSENTTAPQAYQILQSNSKCVQANQFLQKPHNLNNLWLKSIAPITLLKQFLQLQTLPTKQLQHEDSSFQPLLKRSTQKKCSLWGAGNGSARRSSRSRLLALKIKPSPLHTKHWPASGNLIFSLFLHTAAILFFLLRFLSFAASSLHKRHKLKSCNLKS